MLLRAIVAGRWKITGSQIVPGAGAKGANRLRRLEWGERPSHVLNQSLPRLPVSAAC